MKKIIFYLILIVAIIFVSSYGKDLITAGNDNKEINYFSVALNGKYISLGDQEIDFELENLFGSLLVEKVEQIGPGGDTFAGSYKKKLTFKGLELIFFSPTENKEKYWLMEILISGDRYTTSQGIKIGDSVENLKSAYPEISLLKDGRSDPDNCAYQVVDEADFNYIDFEVKDGKIKTINIYKLLP